MNIENIKKKLLFRSQHRGTKEMDVILGGYAEANLKKMDEEKLGIYEKIMDLSDIDLYKWITGKEKVPVDIDNEILREIIRSYE